MITPNHPEWAAFLVMQREKRAKRAEVLRNNFLAHRCSGRGVLNSSVAKKRGLQNDC